MNETIVADLAMPSQESFVDPERTLRARAAVVKMDDGISALFAGAPPVKPIRVTAENLKLMIAPQEAADCLLWWLCTIKEGFILLTAFYRDCCAQNSQDLESSAGERLRKLLKECDALLYPTTSKFRQLPPVALLDRTGDAEALAERLFSLVPQIGARCKSGIEAQKAKAADDRRAVETATAERLESEHQADVALCRNVRRILRGISLEDFKHLLSVAGVVVGRTPTPAEGEYTTALNRLRARHGDQLESVFAGPPATAETPTPKLRKK